MVVQYPEADAIVCLEGTGGQMLGRMLTKESSKVKYIFAFDNTQEACKGLENGVIQGLLIQNQKEMGSIAVQEICRYLQEGSYSAPVVNTSTQIMTAEVDDDA